MIQERSPRTTPIDHESKIREENRARTRKIVPLGANNHHTKKRENEKNERRKEQKGKERDSCHQFRFI